MPNRRRHRWFNSLIKTKESIIGAGIPETVRLGVA